MASPTLTAVSPLDGRYKNKVEELSEFVSEYGLIKTRTEIEIKYLLALSKAKVIRGFSKKEIALLTSIIDKFDLEIAEDVKRIEEETRHDVKAVERSLRAQLQGTSLSNVVEMLHFGITSEDINNLAYRLMLFRATQQIIIPQLKRVLSWLTDTSRIYKALPMLARTHGQAAVPTTLGKEMVIFAVRLDKQIKQLRRKQLTGKFSGAVGNFNALQFSHPRIDWIAFSNRFVSSLGLSPNLVTTQINSYDDICEYVQIYQRINSILIGLDHDLWRYISDGWFVQELKKGEVGSSTMPQKVNPIDFENSEGNLGMANAIAEFFCRKLMISRLQRDLSDSTTIRNIGTLLGYCLVGYKSIVAGFYRVTPNKKKINEDLLSEWSILTEGVQTLLRKQGVKDPYSLISSLSKGRRIDKNQWKSWVSKLSVDVKTKKRLKDMSPENYIGLAVDLTDRALKSISNSKS